MTNALTPILPLPQLQAAHPRRSTVRSVLRPIMLATTALCAPILSSTRSNQS